MREGSRTTKRSTSERGKATRQRSWTTSQSRKQERKKQQDAAHKRNLEAGITPWQKAKAERYVRRAVKHEAWERKQNEGVPTAHGK